MIVRCSFEELTALQSGAHHALDTATCDDQHVAAPPEVVADVEALLSRLDGDLGIVTLAEQEQIESALEFILSQVKERMDSLILHQYVGADDAVNAYFDYSYILTVADRFRRIGQEMRAMIEVMTGEPPTEETRRTITFPD